MINKLIDVSMLLPISMLPSVLNKNNESVLLEFKTLYDDNLKQLLLSLYAPTGHVTANRGEFENLNVNHITVKNTASLYDSIKTALLDIDHNSIGKRFSNGDIASKYINVSKISHDAGSIIYNDSTLDKTLASLINDVSTIKKRISELSGTRQISNPVVSNGLYGAINEDNANNIIDNQKIDYSYDNSYIYASPLLLKRKNLPALHLEDIKKGIIYNYHQVVNGNANVSDDHINIIETMTINDIINIKFVDKKKSPYYYILLSRKTKDLVKVSKDKLNRIQLICTNYSETYGAEWDLHSYSCLHEDDLQLTTLN